MSDVGRRIKAARELSGLSQDALGKLAGVSRFAIGQWEADGSTVIPDTKNLQATAKALGKSVDDLTGSAPALDPPKTPAQLKGWLTGQLDVATRGMNAWMEEIIETQVQERLRPAVDEELLRLILSGELEARIAELERQRLDRLQAIGEAARQQPSSRESGPDRGAGRRRRTA